MKLFEVDDEHRVRIHSFRVTYQEKGKNTVLAEDIVWEGNTTASFRLHLGVRRRLITEPSIDFRGHAVWCRNHEVEDLGGIQNG